MPISSSQYRIEGEEEALRESPSELGRTIQSAFVHNKKLRGRYSNPTNSSYLYYSTETIGLIRRNQFNGLLHLLIHPTTTYTHLYRVYNFEGAQLPNDVGFWGIGGNLTNLFNKVFIIKF